MIKIQKNIKRLSTCVICIMASLTLAISQPLTTVPYNQMLDTADEMMELRDYYNAIEWYEKAYKESRDPNIAAQLGYLNYVVRNYKSSGNYYKRLLARDVDNLFIDERFYYGQVLKAQGEFPEALEQYNQFIELSTEEDNKVIARREIIGMQNAKSLAENEDAVVTYGGNDLNSAFVEYSPRVYNDGDIYFSAIPAKKVVKLSGDDDQFSKIFRSRKSGEGKYEKPESLDKIINRPGHHTGNLAFSPDGKRMYFTRSRLDGNELESSSLFISRHDGEEWGPANEVTSLNGEYLVTHPVVGELFGEEVLFFSSNMEGGEGQLDLYYSTIRGEDSYSAPVNLGPTINTAASEITPFYNNGKLYFSSDGYPGLGGYDIFYTEWDGAKFSSPTNLGKNYNTTYDDMNIAFDPAGDYGYLVSNRPDEDKKNMKSKTCCDDIYEINIRQIILDLNIEVVDANGPLNGAKTTLLDLSRARDEESKENPEGNTFKYILDEERSYKVHITRDGYYPDSIELNTLGLAEDFSFNETVQLRPIPPIPPPVAEPEFETVTINQAIRLNNIYYDFEKWDILPDAEKDLSIIKDLMYQYPDMVIELSSHTDSRGNKPYNQKLSQRRAQSATDWLINQGIAPERIKAIGYGESQILNQCVNGIRCSDEEHRFNRRSEFKIIAGPQEIQIRKEIMKGAVRKG